MRTGRKEDSNLNRSLNGGADMTDVLMKVWIGWRKARAEKKALELQERINELNQLCDDYNAQLSYYHRKGWVK